MANTTRGNAPVTVKEWKTVQVKGISYHIIEGSTIPKLVSAIERSFLDEKLRIIRTDSDTWHQTLDSINMEKKKPNKQKPHLYTM